MSAQERVHRFDQQLDTIEIESVYRLTVASGTVDAQRAAALSATGIPAIGATRYSSRVKCYSRSAAPLDPLRGNIWDVTCRWRTEQFDDLIERAASGTVIERGWSSIAENVLRRHHPTSGATFLLGSSTRGTIASVAGFEPRVVRWYDRVFDGDPAAAATALVGAINSVTWGGYAAGKWLCTTFDTRQVRVEAGTRWLAHVEFALKNETWVAQQSDLIWNERSIASITAATKATAAFAKFRSANFNTHWPTF